MADSIKRFFESLAQREGARDFRGLSGTIRCDLRGDKRTQHWYVTVRRGDVSVSHSADEADCIISTDEATFRAILNGKMNAFACVLRGLCSVEGKIGLLLALQGFFRLAEGPPTEQVAGYARRLT